MGQRTRDKIHNKNRAMDKRERESKRESKREIKRAIGKEREIMREEEREREIEIDILMSTVCNYHTDQTSKSKKEKKKRFRGLTQATAVSGQKGWFLQ